MVSNHHLDNLYNFQKIHTYDIQRMKLNVRQFKLVAYKMIIIKIIEIKITNPTNYTEGEAYDKIDIYVVKLTI